MFLTDVVNLLILLVVAWPTLNLLNIVLQCPTYCPLSSVFLMSVMLLPSLRVHIPVPLSYFSVRHWMFCLSASLSLVARGYQERFRHSYCRNPGCQHLRASALPLAPCITSLPLSPLLALPFLQYWYPHGLQPSGPPQHFLGADQGSSWSRPTFCWMLSPHRGCGSLNRLSYLNDPTDFNFLPWLCPSITHTSHGLQAGGAAGGHLFMPASQKLQKYEQSQVHPNSETQMHLGRFEEPAGTSVAPLSVE